jgi:hypothetical protein
MREAAAAVDSSSSVTELRVAQSELVSGDKSGKVFMRLSKGAVAFRTERPKAQEQVSTKLRRAVLQEDSRSTNDNKTSHRG